MCVRSSRWMQWQAAGWTVPTNGMAQAVSAGATEIGTAAGAVMVVVMVVQREEETRWWWHWSS